VRPYDASGDTETDPKDSELEPEVEAFARWFADWWLRRGSRLYAAAKKADPARLESRKASDENDLPLRWGEETERIVLDREPEPEDAGDPPRTHMRPDQSTK
jgi:hypothetical protein